MIDPKSVDNKAMIVHGQDGQETIWDRLENGTASRSDVDMAFRAVLNKWVVDLGKHHDAMVETCLREMKHGRKNLKAVEVLKTLGKETSEVLERLDKINRLEDDKPTENVGLQIFFEEAKDPD